MAKNRAISRIVLLYRLKQLHKWIPQVEKQVWNMVITTYYTVVGLFSEICLTAPPNFDRNWLWPKSAMKMTPKNAEKKSAYFLH